MPKKENIRRLFDNIAPDYDKLNHILSLDIDKSWRKKAIRETVSPGTALNILDVACGTGDFAIGMGKAAGKGSRITGIDISAGMLEIGKEKIKAEGLSGTIALTEADCEALPFEDKTFDRVTAAFGVRNFEHLETGLKEMHRVVNALPKEYRIPFSMHVAGFKYREIAEKLDLPIGTVKSRIFFTRQRLQRELKDFR